MAIAGKEPSTGCKTWGRAQRAPLLRLLRTEMPPPAGPKKFVHTAHSLPEAPASLAPEAKSCVLRRRCRLQAPSPGFR